MTNDNLSDKTDKSFDNSNSNTVNRNNDNISSMQEEALYYHSLNFNVIPIPIPGEKIAQVWSEEKQAFFDEVADGKSAKGYGSWNEWQ